MVEEHEKVHLPIFVQPVVNSNESLVVSVKMYLQQILDVDEKNQVLTLTAWIEYQWTDYKLKWEPSEYGNIKDIRIPGDGHTIWRPDVLLYNSADENFDSTYPVNYVVSHTGHVLQVPPGILKLSCKIDITYFPFDDQICHLKFGSWTYSGNFIDLRINGPDGYNISEQGMDISYYIENGEWNLLAVPARNETNVFDGEPYPSIYFYLIIQRRTLYYGLNLIIPSLLISLMTVLGFTLPPDAGEKITLEITILLSVCFFLSMVAEMTPPTSDAVPLIGAFFSCCMLVVSASVVFTVLVLNLHNRKPETHEMSPFLREFLLVWLPGVLVMQRPNLSSAEEQECELAPACVRKRYQPTLPPVPDSDMLTSVETPMYHSLVIEKGKCTSICKSEPNELTRYLKNACSELKKISGQIKIIRKRSDEEERDELVENEWKFAAMVIDRLCLFVFTVFIVVSTFGIMLSSPHLIA
ncbi:unnamed protein product [Auanema sp. JU1783]|nr:unnamed protein product [Auanema sp. JU1783]